MQALTDLYIAYPFWIWMGIGVLILAAEVATGSGWLLWSAACAGIVALITLTGFTGPVVDIALFSVLTIATTLTSRRLIKRIHSEDSDINDQTQRLLGKVGRAVGPFVDGRGRAFIDGSEWQADLEEGGELAPGTSVVVTGVAGQRLRVKAA